MSFGAAMAFNKPRCEQKNKEGNQCEQPKDHNGPHRVGKEEFEV